MYHIVSKYVAYTKELCTQITLKTDKLITIAKPCINIHEHWIDVFKGTVFRASFLLLSILDGILSLTDLFSNSVNYGAIIKNQIAAPTQYRAILLDVDISKKNPQYDPDINSIISLFYKIEDGIRFKNYKGELISYKLIQENGYFMNQKIIEFDLTEAINAANNGISEALKLAKAEITLIIGKYKDCFTSSRLDQ